MKEVNLATLHIKQAEDGLNNRPCCNKCKGFILDLHRSCPNCLYNLCLCCWDLYQGNFHGDTNMSLSRCSNKKKTHLSGNKSRIENKLIRTKRNPSSKYIASSASQHDGIACNGIGATSCPSREFGGCGETLLELRCIFPLSCIKELEESAEEIVCSYDLLDTSEISSRCPLCPGTDQKAQVGEQSQEAALKENSNDNLLYCPTFLGLHVISREAFPDMKITEICVNLVIAWIGARNWLQVVLYRFFEGPNKYGRTNTNAWNETLKLRGWLSSQLFEQQFPAHYDEIICTLPLQKYTNLASGLLNLARLPLEIPNPDLGPSVYVSYGYSDQLLQTDSVINLCYDSFDMILSGDKTCYFHVNHSSSLQLKCSIQKQVEEGTWESGGWPQTFMDYLISKLAVNNAYTRLMAKTLSDRPEGQKIYINCFCLGWILLKNESEHPPL